MQTYQFNLTANQRPETLERILRVVRHRGFTVMKLSSEVEEGILSLQATVQSERDIALLIYQLEKLPDVISIN